MDYLIYHPKRIISVIDNLTTIHHDNFKGNQDPYIWNETFLHSFCHITQISVKLGDTIYWVSGDTFPDFRQLECDCVFVIQKKIFWENTNSINFGNSLVDNFQTYEHHYKWVNPPYNQHFFKKKKRYTLKADPEKSFQPQLKGGNLINIIPFLNKNGVSTEELVNSMAKTRNGKKVLNSRPFKMTHELSKKLYSYLKKKSEIKIYGNTIKDLHPNKYCP